MLLYAMKYYGHRHIENYCHDNRIGVLVEFGMDSDYTARTQEFQVLARNVSLQIAAREPSNLEELFTQTFIKNPELTVNAYLRKESEPLGSSVEILRFVCWNVAHAPPACEPDPPNNPKDPASAMRLVK